MFKRKEAWRVDLSDLLEMGAIGGSWKQVVCYKAGDKTVGLVLKDQGKRWRSPLHLANFLTRMAHGFPGNALFWKN